MLFSLRKRTCVESVGIIVGVSEGISVGKALVGKSVGAAEVGTRLLLVGPAVFGVGISEGVSLGAKVGVMEGS